MELVEREAHLTTLDEWLAAAATGRGSLVLISGEAGVGKTSLARAFQGRHETSVRVLWGACDAMRTPRALGPLHDIARLAGGDLARAMAGAASRSRRFGALLDLLVSPARPVLVVLEDLHWADQATLDLLVFLARRVGDTHAVVLASYRYDQVGTDHPLRACLGHLTTAGPVHRIRLEPLSEPATARLAAGHPVDPARLHRITGGNPFFITELLAAPAGTVPETVRDAVLSRAAGLSRPARRVLQAISVVPDRAELPLVAAASGVPALAEIEEAERAGMVRLVGQAVGFRHELARQAVAGTIPAARAILLHSRVLAHLAGQPGTEPARLAHHAEEAGDTAAVLRHAPAAARRATTLGAHRQAAGHYESALRYADAGPRRAELLEEYAETCSLLGRTGEAVDAAGEALATWQEHGDTDRAGRVMARRAGFLHGAGRGKEAWDQAHQAVALLETRPEGPALATACAYAAVVRSAAGDDTGAVQIGRRAVALAQRYRQTRQLAEALTTVGGALWHTDPDRAEGLLARAVEVARECGREATVSLALGSLGVACGESRRYRKARHWLAAAVDWCVAHDLDAGRDYYRACLARCEFEQGRWAPAAELAEPLATAGYPLTRLLAAGVIGRLRTRRGEPGGSAMLASAWRQAEASGSLTRRWRAAVGLAEAAWLAGRAEEIPDLVDETYREAVRVRHPWATGELGYWRWRAGSGGRLPGFAAEPYARQVAGDWAGAARLWDELGCPYEAATARVDGDRQPDLILALETLHRLGARPMADRVAARLRALGVRRLPRRSRRSTLANPGGLTGRELEIAHLLAAELSNADIAARLHISTRTAAHHVSAILAKLKAPDRHQAGRIARSWQAPAR